MKKLFTLMLSVTLLGSFSQQSLACFGRATLVGDVRGQSALKLEGVSSVDHHSSYYFTVKMGKRTYECQLRVGAIGTFAEILIKIDRKYYPITNDKFGAPIRSLINRNSSKFGDIKLGSHLCERGYLVIKPGGCSIM